MTGDEEPLFEILGIAGITISMLAYGHRSSTY